MGRSTTKRRIFSRTWHYNGLVLPPAYKANGGGFSVGYDPYDLFDLGEFDQKVEFHQIWNQRTICFYHQYTSVKKELEQL